MIPPTIPESIALYESVPSIVTADGDAATKRQAAAVEIVRIDADNWRVSMPQTEVTTLPSGKKLVGNVAPINLQSADLIGQAVEIDGQQWPVALAFAIIAAVYDREARA